MPVRVSTLNNQPDNLYKYFQKIIFELGYLLYFINLQEQFVNLRIFILNGDYHTEKFKMSAKFMDYYGMKVEVVDTPHSVKYVRDINNDDSYEDYVMYPVGRGTCGFLEDKCHWSASTLNPCTNRVIGKYTADWVFYEERYGGRSLSNVDDGPSCIIRQTKTYIMLYCSSHDVRKDPSIAEKSSAYMVYINGWFRQDGEELVRKDNIVTCDSILRRRVRNRNRNKQRRQARARGFRI